MLMQILGDLIVGCFIVFVLYKVFLRFGIWGEKRGEKIIEETKKGAHHGQ